MTIEDEVRAIVRRLVWNPVNRKAMEQEAVAALMQLIEPDFVVVSGNDDEYFAQKAKEQKSNYVRNALQDSLIQRLMALEIRVDALVKNTSINSSQESPSQ